MFSKDLRSHNSTVGTPDCPRCCCGFGAISAQTSYKEINIPLPFGQVQIFKSWWILRSHGGQRKTLLRGDELPYSLEELEEMATQNQPEEGRKEKVRRMGKKMRVKCKNGVMGQLFKYKYHWALLFISQCSHESSSSQEAVIGRRWEKHFPQWGEVWDKGERKCVQDKSSDFTPALGSLVDEWSMMGESTRWQETVVKEGRWKSRELK